VPGPAYPPRAELVALGAAIRRHRQARGWTPKQLADEAGVSRRSVGNLEMGLYSARLGAVLDMAHALGVRLVDLLIEAGVEEEDP
jgi:transcriptional regulator with XRE-family HTH domain